MSNPDGKIDFTTYSQESLTVCLTRIDKEQYPINYSAALAELESRKQSGKFIPFESTLASVIAKIRATGSITLISISVLFFLANYLLKHFLNKQLNFWLLLPCLGLALSLVRRYCATFPCPKCGVPFGKVGLPDLIRAKRCVHCGIKEE
jgi:hypothetical protein